MRNTIRLCVCIVALAISPIIDAGAQDSTPAPTGGRAPATGSSRLGAAVPYVDAEGIERGVVAVTEVIDPFDDYAEGYEPAAGAKYVVLHVTFEATGEMPYETDPYDVLVRDDSGFLWSPASVNRGSEPDMPEAQSQTLATGDRISGAIGFVVPEDASLSEVYYQPESGHFILLASFADEDAEVADVGSEVTYVDAEGIEHGIVSVTEVIDPFTDFPEGYEPGEGARYVVIYISFEATGDDSFDANPSNLVVRDANGFLWSPASVNRGSDPDVPDFQSQTLAPGNRISGATGFLVPEETELAQIYYQPQSGHLILLADLEA